MCEFKSVASVFVRVRKLQEKGVWQAFKALLDPKSVGKTLTAIRLILAQPRSLVGMLDALKKLDDIYETYDVTGQYYSIIKIRTDSTEHLSKVLDEIGMIDGVAGTETVSVLRTVKEEFGVKN